MPQLFIAIEILILGGLSIIGCSFVIYCYWKFNVLRTDQLKIVIHIIIFDLIQQILLFSSAVAFLVIDNQEFILSDYPIICYGQAALLQYSLLASTAWTTLIANNLYRTVKYGDRTYRKMVYLMIGFLFPLIMSLLPFAFDAYGISAAFPMSMCSFNSNKPKIRYFILVFQDVPIWSTFVYNAIIFTLVIKELYDHLGSKCLAENKQIFLLFLYPFLVAVCWGMPAMINQFKVDATVWPIISFGFGSLIGLLDSYLYCYLSLVRSVKWVGFSLELKIESIEMSPLK
ncbi:unnamed protein product [Paramecium primaurelia]|uniref:G-protein coupled receptors family 2 profile 2 domain-containing protein n=1 Tax=Paramecium primaurelia TaxID=5886 RepID=A0A8S1LSS4_PARPR|nr:unnamed protein product [Paramecium primaurelia]